MSYSASGTASTIQTDKPIQTERLSNPQLNGQISLIASVKDNSSEDSATRSQTFTEIIDELPSSLEQTNSENSDAHPIKAEDVQIDPNSKQALSKISNEFPTSLDMFDSHASTLNNEWVSYFFNDTRNEHKRSFNQKDSLVCTEDITSVISELTDIETLGSSKICEVATSEENINEFEDLKSGVRIPLNRMDINTWDLITRTSQSDNKSKQKSTKNRLLYEVNERQSRNIRRSTSKKTCPGYLAERFAMQETTCPKGICYPLQTLNRKIEKSSATLTKKAKKNRRVRFHPYVKIRGEDGETIRHSIKDHGLRLHRHLITPKFNSYLLKAATEFQDAKLLQQPFISIGTNEILKNPLIVRESIMGSINAESYDSKLQQTTVVMIKTVDPNDSNVACCNPCILLENELNYNISKNISSEAEHTENSNNYEVPVKNCERTTENVNWPNSVSQKTCEVKACDSEGTRNCKGNLDDRQFDGLKTGTGSMEFELHETSFSSVEIIDVYDRYNANDLGNEHLNNIQQSTLCIKAPSSSERSTGIWCKYNDVNLDDLSNIILEGRSEETTHEVHLESSTSTNNNNQDTSTVAERKNETELEGHEKNNSCATFSDPSEPFKLQEVDTIKTVQIELMSPSKEMEQLLNVEQQIKKYNCPHIGVPSLKNKRLGTIYVSKDKKRKNKNDSLPKKREKMTKKMNTHNDWTTIVEASVSVKSHEDNFLGDRNLQNRKVATTNQLHVPAKSNMSAIDEDEVVPLVETSAARVRPYRRKTDSKPRNTTRQIDRQLPVDPDTTIRRSVETKHNDNHPPVKKENKKDHNQYRKSTAKKNNSLNPCDDLQGCKIAKKTQFHAPEKSVSADVDDRGRDSDSDTVAVTLVEAGTKAQTFYIKKDPKLKIKNRTHQEVDADPGAGRQRQRKSVKATKTNNRGKCNRSNKVDPPKGDSYGEEKNRSDVFNELETCACVETVKSTHTKMAMPSTTRPLRKKEDYNQFIVAKHGIIDVSITSNINENSRFSKPCEYQAANEIQNIIQTCRKTPWVEPRPQQDSMEKGMKRFSESPADFEGNQKNVENTAYMTDMSSEIQNMKILYPKNNSLEPKENTQTNKLRALPKLVSKRAVNIDLSRYLRNPPAASTMKGISPESLNTTEMRQPMARPYKKVYEARPNLPHFKYIGAEEVVENTVVKMVPVYELISPQGMFSRDGESYDRVDSTNGELSDRTFAQIDELSSTDTKMYNRESQSDLKMTIGRVIYPMETIRRKENKEKYRDSTVMRTKESHNSAALNMKTSDGSTAKTTQDNQLELQDFMNFPTEDIAVHTNKKKDSLIEPDHDVRLRRIPSGPPQSKYTNGNLNTYVTTSASREELIESVLDLIKETGDDSDDTESDALKKNGKHVVIFDGIEYYMSNSDDESKYVTSKETQVEEVDLNTLPTVETDNIDSILMRDDVPLRNRTSVSNPVTEETQTRTHDTNRIKCEGWDMESKQKSVDLGTEGIPEQDKNNRNTEGNTRGDESVKKPYTLNLTYFLNYGSPKMTETLNVRYNKRQIMNIGDNNTVWVRCVESGLHSSNEGENMSAQVFSMRQILDSPVQRRITFTAHQVNEIIVKFFQRCGVSNVETELNRDIIRIFEIMEPLYMKS